MFFSFDGIDGTGKSTQVARFVPWLKEQGHAVVECRDPGGTALGERVREILLHRQEIEMGGVAEMLLYMAARAQLVEEVIRPALGRGETVVCDRFLLANVAYQGYGGGLGAKVVRDVGEIAVGSEMPVCVFLLDMPADAAARRMNRSLDRLESRGLVFLKRVRQGYLEEAARNDHIHVIDADQEVEGVWRDIERVASELLHRRHV